MGIKKMSKKTYKKFIDYIFQVCDIVEMSKYSDAHSETTNQIINKVKNDILFDFKNIDNYMNKIYEKYIEDCEIFNKEYIENFEYNTHDFYNQENRKVVLKESIYQYIYITI